MTGGVSPSEAILICLFCWSVSGLIEYRTKDLITDLFHGLMEDVIRGTWDIGFAGSNCFAVNLCPEVPQDQDLVSFDGIFQFFALNSFQLLVFFCWRLLVTGPGL